MPIPVSASALQVIVERGQRFNVWAVDDAVETREAAWITNAWAVGQQQIFRVKTKSGHVIRCTAGRTASAPFPAGGAA